MSKVFDPAARSIHIGDIAVNSKPMSVRTILGSCVSACLFDPAARIGGMNHFLLPENAMDGPAGIESRFGVQAMELLINSMMKLGADRRRLVAKGFGGANVLAGLSSPTAGERNVAFLMSFLQTEKIQLVSHRFGGNSPLQLFFFTHSGRAFVRPVGGHARRHVIHEEERAQRSFHIRGEVTLF